MESRRLRERANAGVDVAVELERGGYAEGGGDGLDEPEIKSRAPLTRLASLATSPLRGEVKKQRKRERRRRRRRMALPRRLG